MTEPETRATMGAAPLVGTGSFSPQLDAFHLGAGYLSSGGTFFHRGNKRLRSVMVSLRVPSTPTSAISSRRTWVSR